MCRRKPQNDRNTIKRPQQRTEEISVELVNGRRLLVLAALASALGATGPRRAKSCCDAGGLGGDAGGGRDRRVQVEIGAGHVLPPLRGGTCCVQDLIHVVVSTSPPAAPSGAASSSSPSLTIRCGGSCSSSKQELSPPLPPSLRSPCALGRLVTPASSTMRSASPTPVAPAGAIRRSKIRAARPAQEAMQEASEEAQTHASRSGDGEARSADARARWEGRKASSMPTARMISIRSSSSGSTGVSSG